MMENRRFNTPVPAQFVEAVALSVINAASYNASINQTIREWLNDNLGKGGPHLARLS